MKTPEIAPLLAPSGERSPTLPSVQYTADMLRRTTEGPAWPESLDYLFVERIARDMRNEYVADLLHRAKKAVADRFARVARSSMRGV